MKEKLFLELQRQGKIPPGLTSDDFTENQLFKLSLNPSVSSNPGQLSMHDFRSMVNEVVDAKLRETTDAIDRKYFKLPNAELTSEEMKGLSETRIKNLKFKKFLSSIFNKTRFGLDGGFLAINQEGGTGTTGGYLVPVEFIAEVSRLLTQYGVFRRNANIFMLDSKTASKPKLNAQPTGQFVDELGAKPESNPTFEQITFTRHDYAFITGLSKQLYQDAAVDLVGLLAELAANDFAKVEDVQGFTGSGSPITGLANAEGTVPVELATTNPNSVTYTDLLAMLTATPYTDGAKWYFHRSVFGTFLSIKDDSNYPIFTPSDQIMIQSTKTFMGYPYELTSVLPDNTAGAEKAIAYFGNLRLAASLAQREGMNILFSDVATVGGNSAFEKNLLFYRFEQSFDIQIEQPGAIAKMITAEQ